MRTLTRILVSLLLIVPARPQRMVNFGQNAASAAPGPSWPISITSPNMLINLGCAGSNTKRGEVVVITGTGGGTITTVQTDLEWNGLPMDGVYAEIFAVNGSGVFTGSVLATSNTVSYTAMNAVSYTLITFTFSGGYGVTGGTSYGISFARTGSAAANCYYAAYSTTQVYAGGLLNTWSGSSWSKLAGSNLYVVVNGTTP